MRHNNACPVFETQCSCWRFAEYQLIGCCFWAVLKHSYRFLYCLIVSLCCHCTEFLVIANLISWPICYRSKNLYQRLPSMHVTKIVRVDWSAVRQSLGHKKLPWTRAAFYSMQISGTWHLTMCHPHNAYLHFSNQHFLKTSTLSDKLMLRMMQLS